jgi:hypothetical protein
MGETEYVIYLDEERQDRYRHFHLTERAGLCFSVFSTKPGLVNNGW